MVNLLEWIHRVQSTTEVHSCKSNATVQHAAKVLRDREDTNRASLDQRRIVNGGGSRISGKKFMDDVIISERSG